MRSYKCLTFDQYPMKIHLSIYISNLFFIGPARTANLNNNLKSNWYDQNSSPPFSIQNSTIRIFPVRWNARRGKESIFSLRMLDPWIQASVITTDKNCGYESRRPSSPFASSTAKRVPAHVHGSLCIHNRAEEI